LLIARKGLDNNNISIKRKLAVLCVNLPAIATGRRLSDFDVNRVWFEDIIKKRVNTKAFFTDYKQVIDLYHSIESELIGDYMAIILVD
jgi:hypothetical protein